MQRDAEISDFAALRPASCGLPRFLSLVEIFAAVNDL